MKRPLAYITAAWSGNALIDIDRAIEYCRAAYETGFSPICPLLYMPLFTNEEIPEEHKSITDMSRDLLRRSRVLLVCGKKIDEMVMDDIATAARLKITATTLEGIITVTKHGEVNTCECSV